MPPFVLHHGLFGFATARVGPVNYSYYGGGIHETLARRGHDVITARVHPTGSIARRAAELKRQILVRTRRLSRNNERVVILAHSMGGLDARYMITHLGMADRVAALVTLSTPHRGSSYAAWIESHPFWQRTAAPLVAKLGLDLSSLYDLTPIALARFNATTPDMPGVRYFSITAERPWHRVPPIFFHSHPIVTAHEGANDGIVSVRSGTWGEHLGTWPADHLHVVNRRYVPEIRDPTGSVLPRYERLFDHLSACGVCGPAKHVVGQTGA